ncbi:putative nucleolar, Nop52 [Helianthus annuus]|nr:putative nucleolar, Nop52 [Helianthus annuus]KAJ0671076.1 putative nucleolar, Nop52 [Helianthus annuus]
MAVEQSTTTTTTTDPPTAITQPQSLPLIRNLASCNTAARSKALRELTSWLPTQPQISDDEMKKLWKGLFYCIWHADKAPVQSNLINKLSSMLLTLDVPLSLHYLSVFFTTVRREWSGIDVLRLDKFYLLIRRFVFLDELNGYLPVSGQEVYQVFEILFKPLLRVMSVSEDKVLVGKIKSNVFERLLCMGKSLIAKKKSGGEGEGEEDSEVVNLGTIALKMGFASKFYDLGSGSECFQGNRKVLFGLNKEFLKLEKELEASGVDVKFPTVEGDDGDEEVPDLVPIVGNETQNSSVLLLEGSKSVAEGSKKSSKKKKKKKGAKEGLDSEKQETGKENDDANMITANGESASNGVASDTNDVSFTELFKSNLQKEFEKVAEEDGLDKDGESSLHEDLSTITISSTKVSKKRKRVKSVEARGANNGDNTEQGGTAMKSGGEKSAKKVRFSKNNLVWKPQSPLPPQSLRIPPSVTPRGSALKKGVPPGPIREMPPAVKKAKKKKAKVRKVMKTTSPAMKRLRKLQTLST